jgi:hypothetical protein
MTTLPEPWTASRLLVPVCVLSKTTLMWGRDCAWAPALKAANNAARIMSGKSCADLSRAIGYV